MTLQRISADAVPPQPWRNGGGRTRELLAWPPGPDWRLRLSLADIEADGPFSAFAGVQRWFAVIEGAGVHLQLPQGPRTVGRDDAPLQFDGAAAPGCTLVDGPTRDLNLMLRGVTGALHRATGGQDWNAPWPWRAAFSAGSARLDHAGGSLDLAPRTLLSGLPGGVLRLHGDAPMWWIGAEVGST
jgi:uncharacterized protein